MNNSPAMPEELGRRWRVRALGWLLHDRPCAAGGERPGTAWHSMAALAGTQEPAAPGRELAARASQPGVTVWRAQPVVEVCTATDYPAWRKARERAWERDGNRYSVRTWPERITEGELAAVLLMQSHSGHPRGQPAEIVAPASRASFRPGSDIEHPTNRSRSPSWSAG